MIGKRRSVKGSSELNFTFIKAVIILMRGKLNYLIFRGKGLNDRPAGFAASA